MLYLFSRFGIQLDFDANKQIERLTDVDGNAMTFTYTGTDLSAVHDAFGRTLTFQYSGGRIGTVSDSTGRRVAYTYDADEDLVGHTDPESKLWEYGYDTSHRMTSLNDGLPNTATDGRGTLTTLTYDAYGHPQTTQTDGHPAITYTYDAAGRLLTRTDRNGQIVTYPGNKAVTYGYDALNRLATVTNWLGQTATYSYDLAGRLTKLANFNGLETDYAFDAADRLTDLVGSAASYHFLTLDGNGNPTATVKSEPMALQLNPSSISHTYNPQKNRLLQAGVATFGYDDEGQLNTGYGASYTFDYEHRLTGVSGMMQYSYDGAGNRLQAVRDGIYTTRYIYDAAGNLLAEADGDNTITRYYIHGLGLLAMVTPADQAYCYHFNTIGSTIALTDQSQTVVNTYAYDPFGNNVDQLEAVPQPFKFVGEYGIMTEPNGFYYMRARYYDPQVGRFVSEDPLGFEGGDVNLMAYVGNNPVMLIDPLGLCAEITFGGAVGQMTNGIAQAAQGLWGALNNENLQKDTLHGFEMAGKGAIVDHTLAAAETAAIYDVATGGQITFAAMAAAGTPQGQTILDRTTSFLQGRFGPVSNPSNGIEAIGITWGLLDDYPKFNE